MAAGALKISMTGAVRTNPARLGGVGDGGWSAGQDRLGQPWRMALWKSVVFGLSKAHAQPGLGNGV